ncbi:MAG: peptidoglycan-binding domain-containing protein [Nitrospinota bacterium]
MAGGVPINPSGAPEVLALQEALKKAGGDPGPMDRIVGRKTRAFQKRDGRKTTGRADKETIAKLKPFM